MKLKSVTVRKYRIHNALTVEFDPRLTLIVGPNESGKSTLVSAIHRALFLKAKVGGATLEEMKSVQGGIPSVELALSVGGQDCLIQKEFRGARGSTTLALAGQSVLNDDAAEEKLAELLHVGKPVDGKGAAGQLAKRWAHLWVWQGAAGISPTETVAEQQNALVQRLQAQGGAAVTQSDLDARVFHAIQARRDALFTERGDVRKGSALALAEEELAALQAALREKQAVVQSLEDAVARYTRAVETIEEKTRAQAAACLGLAESEQRLARVEDLNRALDPVKRSQVEASAGIAEQEKILLDLSAARQSRDAGRAALAPREQALEALRMEQGVCREALKQAEAAWEVARVGAVAARVWKGALDARLQALERKRDLDGLLADQAALAVKRTEQASVRDEMTRTPPVRQKDLAILQKLAQELAAAEAACTALGARIEILASHEPISVDGQAVAAGASAVITRDADVAIGSVATLRIKPGSSTGIAEARRTVDSARQLYNARLIALGVPSLQAAGVAHEKLRALQGRLEMLQAELDHLKADGNEEAVRNCAQAHAEAFRRAGQAAAECGRTLPEDLASSRSAFRDIETECRQADVAERSAESAYKAARGKATAADAGFSAASSGVEGLRRQAQDAVVRIKTIEDQFGADDSRAARMVALRARRDQASAEGADLQRQLDVLQPGQLHSDVTRLKGVLQQAQDAIHAAAQDKAAAGERLRLSGTTDPHADEENTRAALERAERRRNELREQAEAVKHLAGLAADVQRGVTERINKPLEDAAQGYLECVFGAGARAVLAGGLQSAEAPSFQVNREHAGMGTFDFAALSGGAREQVGIAMRLAMAEVLAADHNGSLPLVLDDAFANSDPERVRSLQRMLYRAGERGLQVIVLTCNPSDYSTLGAKETWLERPVLRGASSGQSAPEAGDRGEPSVASVVAVSDEDSTAS